MTTKHRRFFLQAALLIGILAPPARAVDIWMDVDVDLPEVPVNLLPLLDDTDFKTREESVAYNAAGLELIWHFTTTAGATSATVVTPTSGGAYDWAHQDGGLYTIEIPASGGASINNNAEGFGWFTGVATGVLPWRGPIIGFRKASMNNVMINNGALQDNLEDEFDGTGYAGGTIYRKVDVQTVAGETPETAADIVSTIDSSSTLLTGIDTKIGTPSVDLASDVAAVKSDTAAILIDTGTDGVIVAPDSKTGYSLSSAQTFDLTGNITGSLSGSVGSVAGSVGSVSGAVGSVTAPVTVGVNNDKTGYALTSAYDAAKTALTETAIVDGTVTIKDVMECLLAFMCGRATITDNGSTWTIQYYKRDNATVKFNLTASEADGARAAAGTVNP